MMCMMLCGRRTRGGAAIDLVLVAVFCTLAYIFFTRKSYTPDVSEVLDNNRKNWKTFHGSDHVSAHKSGKGKTHVDASENVAPDNHLNVRLGKKGYDSGNMQMIDSRVKRIPDARSSECKDLEYRIKDTKVTIIIDFRDYNFVDLKLTLSSVLAVTKMDLIEEILVVDDHSGLAHIKEDTDKFIASMPKTRLLRNAYVEGQSGSRMLGAREAKGDILVFLDTNVIVNHGWLEPLLDALSKDDHIIAVPHYDRIHDPVSLDYEKTDDSLVGTLSWSLFLRMRKSPDRSADVTSRIRTPAVRGSALAVVKKFFISIGGYDPEFAQNNGENAELSIRNWMCGGGIYTFPCSRVGVLNLNDPVKCSNHGSVRRIAELWFGKRKNMVYRHQPTGDTYMSDVLGGLETESLKKRQAFIENLHLKCHNTIDWYLENVAKEISTPSEQFKFYGIIKCKTGRCARVAADSKIELVDCLSEYFTKPPPEMLFEIDVPGHLMALGKCITTKSSAYVVAEDCKDGDSQQKYEYDSKHRLVNEWSRFCLMHVTDPEKKDGGGAKRQIAMAQSCNTSEEAQFAEFEFITL